MYGSGYERGGFESFTSPIPPIIKILLWANVGVFALDWLTSMMFGRSVLATWFGLSPRAAVEGFQVWQFVTYAYLHSLDNPFHILINMLMLWMFGMELAKYFGARRFLVLYHFAIVLGGIGQVVADYVKHTEAVVIGASGAIIALMVVYAFLFPRRRVLFMFIIPIEMRVLVPIIVGLDLVFGTKVLSTGTAHFCHLGGALAGFLYYRYHGRVERFWERMEDKIEEREAQREDDIRATVDELLEKIRRDGIHTLSAKEKRFLNNASKLYKKEDHVP